jgi:hypothetical protein
MRRLPAARAVQARRSEWARLIQASHRLKASAVRQEYSTGWRNRSKRIVRHTEISIDYFSTRDRSGFSAQETKTENA